MSKTVGAFGVLVAALALAFACGGVDDPNDGLGWPAADAGTRSDAGASDAGVKPDAGPRPDAGTSADAGVRDGGAVPDAGSADAGPTMAGSCKEAALDSCTDYSGKGPVIAEAQSRCGESAGAWATSACATTNRLGTCAKNDTWTGFGAVAIKCRYYKGDTWTATSASADCRDYWQGTWSAP